MRPDTIQRLPDHWREFFLRMAADQRTDPGWQPTLRDVLLSLRDMPYARPQGGNTAEACVSEWMGTCSAKHLAAHEWLTLTGHHPRLWMASYVMDFRQTYFSSTLKAAAAGIKVYDVHNFLTCDLGHGEIVIDITFPASLERHGFPVTADWDGESDFTLCCTPQERIELDPPESVSERKRAWLRSLNTEQAQVIREAAILEMARYIHL